MTETEREGNRDLVLNQAFADLAGLDSVYDGATFLSIEIECSRGKVEGYRTRLYTVAPDGSGGLSAVDSIGWCGINDSDGLVQHLISGIITHSLLYEETPLDLMPSRLSPGS